MSRRVISAAVRHYVKTRSQQNLRERLKQEALANAERDLEIAQEWFPPGGGSSNQYSPLTMLAAISSRFDTPPHPREVVLGAFRWSTSRSSCGTSRRGSGGQGEGTVVRLEAYAVDKDKTRG